jgi:KaiC/GvpD/RAD55 family RecA-like ATPase
MLMENIGAEFLSACMLSSENTLTAMECGVSRDWFRHPGHGDVWDSLCAMTRERAWGELDNIMALHASGLFDRYPEALDICEVTPAWGFGLEGLKTAVDALRSSYMAKIVTEHALGAVRKVQGGCNPVEVAEGLGGAILSVLGHTGISHRSTREIAEEALRMDERVASGECVGLPFPWEGIQSRTFGIPFKAVTPLAGRDGKGKSWLASFLAHHWLTLGIPGLFMPIEDSAERFVSKLAAIHGGYDMFTIRSGNAPPGFMARHATAMDAVSKLPLAVEDAPCTPDKLVSHIAAAKRSHGIRWVVVDGLKDVILPKTENQTTAENAIVASLVRASKEYDLAIIPVSHLTDIEDDRWISKRMIRGTKTQSQSARMVMIYQDSGFPSWVVQRHLPKDGDIVLDVQKASYGNPGTVCLKPEFFRGRFVESGA